MVARRQKAELLSAEKPIPAGTKRVRSTRVEEFEQPIDVREHLMHVDEQAAAADDTAEAVEVDAAQQDEELLEELEPQSPVDNLLRSIEGASDHSLYIIRKPDPVGLTISFSNPCNVQVTLGEIPYDESYQSKETVDLAVQSMFGGGKYLIQLRRAGQYRNAWTTVIPDPPMRREREPEKHSERRQQDEAPVQRFKSFADEAKEFAEVAKAFGLVPQRSQPLAGPSNGLPPADPTAELERTLGMADRLISMVRAREPEGGHAASERSTIGDLAELFRSLKLGDAVAEGAKVLVPMLYQQMMARQPNAAGANITGEPAPASLPPPPAPQPPAPPTPSPAELAFTRLLRRVAADMASSTEVDNLMDEETAVEETLKLINAFPEFRLQVEQVLTAPPPQLVLFVAANVNDQELLKNPGSELFVIEFQNALRAALQPAPADVLEFPSVAPAVDGASAPIVDEAEPTAAPEPELAS